jgi:hypothetical protein
MDSSQILQLLQSTLDPNPNVRLQAELHLSKAFEAPRAFPLLLETKYDRGGAHTTPSSPPRRVQRPRSDLRRSRRSSRLRFTGDRCVLPTLPWSVATRATRNRFSTLSTQAASFALKKYVKEYWSPFFSTFKGPHATTPEVRPSLRTLFRALGAD